MAHAPQDKLKLFFERFEQKQLYHGIEKLDRKNFMDVLVKIGEEWEKRKHGVCIYPIEQDVHCYNYKFLNARYALLLKRPYGENDDFKLFLLDNYHGQQRQLQASKELLKDIYFECSRIECVNEDRWLLFQNEFGEYRIENGRPHRDYHGVVRLLHMDFQNGTCSLLDSKRLPDRYIDANIDCYDAKKFVAYVRQEYTYCLYLGRVEDNCVIFEPECVQMNEKPLFGQLAGNKLKCLCLTESIPYDGDRPEFPREGYFGEYELIPGQENPAFNKLTYVKSQDNSNQSDVHRIYWHGNTCCTLASKDQFGGVLFLDLDNGELRDTYNYHLNLHGSCVDVYFDESGALMICTRVSYGDDQGFMVYRYTHKKLDSLADFTFFKLRRDLLFCEDETSQEIFEKLPAHLQPFAQYPLLQKQQSNSVENDDPCTSTVKLQKLE
ncbi:hypothetical protein M3Y97_00911400 [Aphelenchoides bicaudatus]|nr:hypothetical protein M3Y97_00911400 [Aphelenchoides bicaudatus]